MNISWNSQELSRRFSTSNIEIKYPPPDPGKTIQPPPKPPTPSLKLYPWMTRKESPPPQREMIKCQYQTNNCTETLPRSLVLWRRHFAKKHGLVKDAVLQVCQWPGCGITMGGRSLNRHVLVNHMDFKSSCPYCEERLRSDHMKKHLERCTENPATSDAGEDRRISDLLW